MLSFRAKGCPLAEMRAACNHLARETKGRVICSSTKKKPAEVLNFDGRDCINNDTLARLLFLFLFVPAEFWNIFAGFFQCFFVIAGKALHHNIAVFNVAARVMLLESEVT